MLKILKAVHIVGVAMFLGSIFAHIAAGQVPGAADDPPAMLFARQAIDLATRYVTLPGLAIALISGALMAAGGYPGLLKRRWLAAHAFAALIVTAITVTVMIPAGRQILAAAAAVAGGTGSREAFAAFANREHIFGALNIVLVLGVIVLGTVKPRLRQSQQ
jgi:hypothetical protein